MFAQNEPLNLSLINSGASIDKRLSNSNLPLRELDEIRKGRDGDLFRLAAVPGLLDSNIPIISIRHRSTARGDKMWEAVAIIVWVIIVILFVIIIRLLFLIFFGVVIIFLWFIRWPPPRRRTASS